MLGNALICVRTELLVPQDIYITVCILPVSNIELP